MREELSRCSITSMAVTRLPNWFESIHRKHKARHPLVLSQRTNHPRANNKLVTLGSWHHCSAICIIYIIDVKPSSAVQLNSGKQHSANAAKWLSRTARIQLLACVEFAHKLWDGLKLNSEVIRKSQVSSETERGEVSV